MNNMFNRIPAFKWFVLQNFPFIEEDFDAITNYQLLCKIVEYLNTTIDKTNELGNQVEVLTNWFNNLDVQDEIDNKLDDMAESGQLAEIINEQIFGQLNDRVTQNKGDISTLQENVDNIKEDIKNINEDIENINNNLNNKENLLDKLVVFGDSWSDLNVTDAIWSTNVASELNLTLHNYAVNGAGFVAPSNNLISTQITIFSNSNVDKTKVKFIVLAGGLNDYRNNVTVANLVNAISSAITDLKNLCPQAKIVYISNCQYPYTRSQSFYWVQLHNQLSTNHQISTYNIDGTFGKALFNNNNYFHLTQAGQLLWGRNIVATLTGGEIINYRNQEEYEDSDIKIVYSTQRIKDMIFANLVIRPKTNLTNKSISFSSPGLSYPDLDIIGAVGRSYRNFIAQISSNSLLIASDGEMSANNNYYISVSVPVSDYY